MKIVRSILSLLLVLATMGQRLAGQSPYLSEILAENGSSITDQDGETSDWIEIHHPGVAPINLQGWYLTDDPLIVQKWRFPSVSVAPGGFLLVFASGKNRAAAGAELHTNFRLDSGGDYLALVEPDGATVASQFTPFYPPQKADISFGLSQQVLADKLVAAGAPARVLVPASNALGLSWTGSPDTEPFADGSWRAATTGIGYPAGGGSASPPPLVYWTFDDTTLDASGNGHTLSLNGAAYSSDVPSQLGGGKSLSFDGADDYGVAEVNVSETAYTISLWFKADAAGRGIFTVVDGDRGANGHDRHLYLSGGNIASRVWNNEVISSTGKAYGDRRWRHLAQVIGTATGGTRIYVDGVVVATGAKTASDFNWQQYVNVGFSNDGASPYFDGFIDDLAIWEAELTAAEIQALAAGASPLAISGYGPWVATDLETEMRGVNASAYVRIPFAATLPADYDSIVLRTQYDDGFTAYLNGVEVLRRNAPGTLTYNSAATANRLQGQAIRPEDVDLGQYLGLLRNGLNLLAIHALNDAAASSDFLLVPELLKVLTSANRYMSEPTPGAPNSVGVIDFVADTQFSVDRGFFDAPFSVEVTCATPGARIYTTIDGSVPSESNAAARLYTGPITVSRTTMLRAAAYKDDFLPTNVDTQTYIFLTDVRTQPASPQGFPTTWLNGTPADYQVDPDVVNTTRPGYSFEEALLSLPTLSVVTTRADLFDASRGIYYNPYGRGIGAERPASLELIHPDGSEGFQVDAGIRMHGNSSRDHGFTPKHPIRVNFRRQYGPAKLDHPLFDDSEVEDFDHILLRGCSTDSWPVVDGGPVLGVQRWAAVHAVYMRDEYMRRSQLAMGRPSCHGTYVHLFLDGLYWGLYNISERPVDSFNAAHFGGKKEEYDVIKDFAELEAGTGDAWNQMISLANAGLATDAAYQRIQGNNPDGTPNPAYPRYLDVDNLMDYMILHIASGAEDWPHHNWWSARRRGPLSEGFKFFSWDQEISNDSLVRQYTLFQTRFENPIADASPSMLYGKCMANPRFRQEFMDRVHRHLFNDGVLSPGASSDRWFRLAAEIDKAIVGESARWGDTRRAVPYKREVEWLNEHNFMRSQYWPGVRPIAIKRFRDVGLYPDTEAPLFHVGGSPQHGGHFTPGQPLTMTLTSEPSFIDIPLAGSSTNISALVPTGAAPGVSWRLHSYVEGSSGETWKQGLNGVGYETGTGYESIIKIDVRAEMYGATGNNSVYIRIPFAIADQATIDSFDRLTLRVLYDDGFAAYLNGTRVDALNAPEEAAMTWNATATAGTEAVVGSPTELDLTASINRLRVGQNLLAIHGLNFSNGSSDMLIHAELIAGRLDVGGPPGNVYYTLDGNEPSAAGALRYTGPIVLNDTTLVKARAFENNEWSALTEAYFVDATALPLRVTEIHYHPEDPGAATPYSANDLDFLEIRNLGPTRIQLAGVRIEGAVIFDFTASGVPSLGPGEYAVVVEDEAAFLAHYGFEGIAIAGQYEGKLSDGGEAFTLKGPIGETLLEVRYDDAWQPATDGGGYALVITDDALPTDAWTLESSWTAGSVRDGTPGAGETAEGGFQLPGDLNQDAAVDLSDALSLLLRLFGGLARPLPCDGASIGDGANRDLADLNGDGFVTLPDAVYLLSFIFREGPAPARGVRCLRLVGCPNVCVP
jgi:hypothetical protein